MKEILEEMLAEAREGLKMAKLYGDVYYQGYRLGKEEVVTEIINLLDKLNAHTVS